MQEINRDKIKKFLIESVEWLQKEQMGCCRYKLDDHLAIFVGWSDGYDDEKDDNLIQARDYPTYAINVGIKVWTSDDLWTDYDWINFPYREDGEVYDMGMSISPNDNYDHIVQDLLELYGKASSLTITDDGKIIRENMWVCEHCLWAIESREGHQATLAHYVNEEDECSSKCDWCEEDGFDLLYELV